jgi:hypothetical protein
VVAIACWRPTALAVNRASYSGNSNFDAKPYISIIACHRVCTPIMSSKVLFATATCLAHESPGLSRQVAVADNTSDDKVEVHTR